MKNITEFTVYMPDWLRGEGAQDSYLIREKDKKKCCLGMAICAMGGKEEDFLDIKSPRSFENGACPKQFLDEDNENLEWINEAMTINDDRMTLDKVKIELLTPLFKENGIDIKFSKEKP